VPREKKPQRWMGGGGGGKRHSWQEGCGIFSSRSECAGGKNLSGMGYRLREWKGGGGVTIEISNTLAANGRV